MEYLQLNHSDLTVSRFCMGGCPMGGFDWGETNQQDFIKAIHTALAEGVTFFDTADTYGLGQSEKTLAKGLGCHRKDVVIQTKFGVRAGNGKTVIDNSPEWIREATKIQSVPDRSHAAAPDLCFHQDQRNAQTCQYTVAHREMVGMRRRVRGKLLPLAVQRRQRLEGSL